MVLRPHVLLHEGSELIVCRSRRAGEYLPPRPRDEIGLESRRSNKLAKRFKSENQHLQIPGLLEIVRVSSRENERIARGDMARPSTERMLQCRQERNVGIIWLWARSSRGVIAIDEDSLDLTDTVTGVPIHLVDLDVVGVLSDAGTTDLRAREGEETLSVTAGKLLEGLWEGRSVNDGRRCVYEQRGRTL